MLTTDCLIVRVQLRSTDKELVYVWAVNKPPAECVAESISMSLGGRRGVYFQSTVVTQERMTLITPYNA